MLSFKEVDPSVLGPKYRAIKKNKIEITPVEQTVTKVDIPEEFTTMIPVEKAETTPVEQTVTKVDIPAIVTYPTPNQKVKADAGKPRLSLVPPQIIFEIAKVREYGNNKYPDGGPDNWKQVEVSRYRDAAFRHLLSYIQDPDGVDEESGISHLSHLACNIAFLCELERK